MNTQREMGSLRRDCPQCGREIMAAATLCGFCWVKLTPLPEDSPLARRVAPPLSTDERNRDHPEMRQYLQAARRHCPQCGREIMAAATRCGYCWVQLTPPVDIEPTKMAASAPLQPVIKPARGQG